MAFKDIFGKSEVDLVKPSYAIYQSPKDLAIFQEQFKGQVAREEIKFPADLGEKHPFDFLMTEKLYKEYGLITGVVDKFIDFVVGPGFHVKCEVKAAQDILDQYMKDVNFDTVLRAWLKEAMVKGTGFTEIGVEKGAISQLKVLNSNYIYIKRDETGEIEGYNQYIYGLKFWQAKKNTIVHFEPSEIAMLAINTIGDMAYGMGIVAPGLVYTNNLIDSEKSMHQIMRRKANSPVHAKLGDLSTGIMPTEPDVTAFGKKLETMGNKTEWATGPEVEFKILDFGKMADKFTSVLDHDLDMLFFTYQVPEVLMGRGSIPEGLAKVQLEAFQRRIQSIQAEAERVIENDILKRVLVVNGIDSDVEFEWGEPSDTEKNQRIDRITILLQSMNLSPEMRYALEMELAQLMGFVDFTRETPEEERAREENEPQPAVPGGNRFPEEEHVHTANCNHLNESLDPDGWKLKEWLGFNYRDYIDYILDVVAKEGFTQLLASNALELEAGFLSEVQVDKLRTTLKWGFDEGKSIRDIAKRIREKVAPKDLYKIEDGKVGRKVIGSYKRSIAIARTETTRLAADGSLDQYKDFDIEKVRFVASSGARTCPTCEGLNGVIYPLHESYNKIPVHPNCRCTWIPITALEDM